MLRSSNTIHFIGYRYVYYHMVTEYNEVLDLHQVGLIVRVVLLNELQYLQFDEGLVEELLLASDDLESGLLLPLVIKDLEYTAKRTLTQQVQYLVPVRYVVFHTVQVLASIYILTIIYQQNTSHHRIRS
jgi:hypothetical protein